MDIIVVNIFPASGGQGLKIKINEKSKCVLKCVMDFYTDGGIFYGIWIAQSGAMVFIFNLDKVSLKKLFPTMNI